MKDNFDREYALKLYNSKEYKEHFNYCIGFAENGNADAQNMIGLCYKYGEGIEKDLIKAVEWFTRSAIQGYAKAQCNLGVCYQYGTSVEKNEEKAVEWYTKAAEQGYARAQCNLGVCYEYGTGVEKNEEKAVEWYTKAAEQGIARAQCNLGACYEFGSGVDKNEYKAAEWYTKAAEEGYAYAQYLLGYCYESGSGVDENQYKAVELYKKAAEQDCDDAQCKLGLCYRFGMPRGGIRENMVTAVEWFTKAAKLGNAEAQYNLAMCYQYLYGIGIDVDLKKAVELYEKAAKQGFMKAQKELAICYEVGIGVEKNSQKAVEWYLKAAGKELDAEHTMLYSISYDKTSEKSKDNLSTESINQKVGMVQKIYSLFHDVESSTVNSEKNDIMQRTKTANKGRGEAQLDLGLCYEEGRGVNRDERKAVKLYMKAAKQDIAEAQYRLGLCCKNATGTSKNIEKAVEMFIKASEADLPDAQFELGQCYENGIVVEENYKKAVELYFKSADNGCADALFSAGECYEYGTGVEENNAKAIAYFKLAMDKGIKKAKQHYEKLRNLNIREDEYQAEIKRLQESERKYKEDLEREKEMSYMSMVALSNHTALAEEMKSLRTQICEVDSKVSDLSSYIKNELPKLRSDIIGDLREQDEKFDQKLGEFIKKAAEMLQEKLNFESKDLLTESEEELKEFFGDIWNSRMLEETKTSLISARTLWKKCREIPEDKPFDYSGVVICATAALEYELRRWFFDGFKDYLNNQGINIEKWPEILTFFNYYNNIKSASTIFTMGTLPFLFGQISKKDRDEIKNDVSHLELCREAYLSVVMKDKHGQKKYSDCFTENVFFTESRDLIPVRENKTISAFSYNAGSLIAHFEYIREVFRNKSAHANQIPKKAAEECCARIMGKYEADENFGDVCSVLKQLYILMK